ncbi:MAG: phage tail protein [Deltaproteobacteria bacterium]|nr:phage tail protein [Deltaproteobacteria bacterium]
MIPGVVVGIVTDNKDPENLGRIKVEYPVDSDPPVESCWARTIRPMAGKDRGMVVLPEIGTEVLVGFAYQTLTPYVLGALHNGEDTPPYGNEDGDNTLRTFHSRSGHEATFDDTQGSEKIEVVACNETVSVVLDAPASTLTATADEELTHEASQKISLKCMDFELKASKSVSIDAGSDVVAGAGIMATLEASALQNWKGATVNVNK